jgi:hypothetical protein
MVQTRITDTFCIGEGHPLALIGGPCVIESEDLPEDGRGRRSASASTCPSSLSRLLIRRIVLLLPPFAARNWIWG